MNLGKPAGILARLPANKLALIKATIDRWSSSTQRTRHLELVLSRLPIGHTRVTHGPLMIRSDPPRCPSFHVPLSVVHFLIDCPRYASLCFLPCNLTLTLGVSLSLFSVSPLTDLNKPDTNLFSFLAESNLP